MFRLFLPLMFIFAAVLAIGGVSTELERARVLYQGTDYSGVLQLLTPVTSKTAETFSLIGQARFMSGDHKKAAEAFEKAVALEPRNSRYLNWLGKSYGRQAESASILTAPGLAVKARQAFEKAVASDPNNKEALNDLFEYYIDAPGFLGGGLDRADQLVAQIARIDEAEAHFATSQLAVKRKDFSSAEQQLHRAIELAPRQVGRVLDLAKFLARRDRVSESDQVFVQAAKLAPDSPQVLFDRAALYIKQKRQLDEAVALLEKYIRSPLTPDNVPREKALQLLKQAKGD